MDETFLDPTILNGLNSTYIADLYEKWLDDPKSIDSNWNEWFADLKADGSFNDIPLWARGKSLPSEILNTREINTSLSSDQISKFDSISKICNNPVEAFHLDSTKNIHHIQQLSKFLFFNNLSIHFLQIFIYSSPANVY